MVVAMQHKFRSVLGQNAGEILVVFQASPKPCPGLDGWVMDHHHPKQPCRAGFIENARQCIALGAPDLASGHEG